MRCKTNPLPGANPWLEAYWGDIHTKLTTYACDQIQLQLPEELHARVEEYLAVEAPEEDTSDHRRISPDVHIVELAEKSPSAPISSSAETSVMEPIRVRRSLEPVTLRWIKIVDVKENRRVVTAIEFISPANKASEKGRSQYQAKQRQLIEGGVNLVEIDLLRSGGWVVAVDKAAYPARLQKPYRICVVRATDNEFGEVYAASFKFSLPTISIPLRPDDADVKLSLQSLVNTAYENGRYGSSVDYKASPRPPLNTDEQEWINTYLSTVR